MPHCATIIWGNDVCRSVACLLRSPEVSFATQPFRSRLEIHVPRTSDWRYALGHLQLGLWNGVSVFGYKMVPPCCNPQVSPHFGRQIWNPPRGNARGTALSWSRYPVISKMLQESGKVAVMKPTSTIVLLGIFHRFLPQWHFFFFFGIFGTCLNLCFGTCTGGAACVCTIATTVPWFSARCDGLFFRLNLWSAHKAYDREKKLGFAMSCMLAKAMAW